MGRYSYRCNNCIVMPVCAKVCSGILYNVDTIREDLVCIDCGGYKCFQYVAGLYYMVCLRCRTAYYFSVFEEESRLCRSNKRDLNVLLALSNQGMDITYTTFQYAIHKYNRGDYTIIGDYELCH